MSLTHLKILILSIFTLANSVCFAQFFQKHYGTANNETGESVIKTSDGNLIFCGRTSDSSVSNSSDVLVSKLDVNGNIIWSKKYAGNINEFARGIIETNDNGFALVGTTNSFGLGNDEIFLLKIDANGTLQWSKTYGNSTQTRGFSVIQTQNGDFYLGGITSLDDPFIVRTDLNGNLIWSKTFGSYAQRNIYNLLEESDGIVFTGSQSSYGTGLFDIWVGKIDFNGNLTWLNAYGTAGQEQSRIIRKTNDGNYIVIGHTDNSTFGGWDVLLLKIDIYGNLTGNNTFGETGNDFIGNIIVDQNDFFITFQTNSFSSTDDLALCKIDEFGNIINSKLYGENSFLSLTFGAQNSIEIFNNQVFLIGNVAVGNIASNDIYFQSSDLDGLTCDNFDVYFNESSINITTTPINIATVDVGQESIANFIESTITILEDIICDEINIQPPQAIFTFNNPICENDCINFTNQSVNAQNHFWNFEGANVATTTDVNPNNICFANNGNYNITLIVQNDTLFDTLTQQILVNEVNSNINETYIGCQGDGFSFTSPSGIIYDESNPTGNEILFNNFNCEYEVNVDLQFLQSNSNITETYNGCVNDGYIFTSPNGNIYNEQNPTGSEIVILASGCEYELNVDLNYNALSANELESYVGCLNDGYTFTSTNGNIYNQTNPTGTEILQDLNGCNFEFNIDLQFNDLPFVNLGNDTTYCYFNQIILNSNNTTANFLWNTNDTTATININQEGNYWVAVEENGCINYDTIAIEILEELKTPMLDNDTTLCNGFEIMLNVEDEKATNYLWNSSQTTPNITISNEGNYNVTISNTCETKTSNNIKVKYKNCFCRIDFPNVFSPNFDNINDYFFPNYDCIINTYELMIFNRWGEMVFQTFDINEKWDGTYKNKPLNNSVFVYIAKVNALEDNGNRDKFFKGNVTLLK